MYLVIVVVAVVVIMMDILRGAASGVNCIRYVSVQACFYLKNDAEVLGIGLLVVHSVIGVVVHFFFMKCSIRCQLYKECVSASVSSSQERR